MGKTRRPPAKRVEYLALLDCGHLYRRTWGTSGPANGDYILCPSCNTGRLVIGEDIGRAKSA